MFGCLCCASLCLLSKLIVEVGVVLVLIRTTRKRTGQNVTTLPRFLHVCILVCTFVYYGICTFVISSLCIPTRSEHPGRLIDGIAPQSLSTPPPRSWVMYSGSLACFACRPALGVWCCIIASCLMLSARHCSGALQAGSYLPAFAQTLAERCRLGDKTQA